jgi:hypothetical protein
MMATEASLVSSWRVPSRAARVLNILLRRVVRCPGWMCRPGGAPRNTQLVLGCEAVRLWPGFAASSRQGLSKGSGRAMWIVPSWTVTSSSVTVTSSHVSRAMFTSITRNRAHPGPVVQVKDTPARAPDNLHERRVVACFDQVGHVGMPEAVQPQFLGQSNGVPCSCEGIPERTKRHPGAPLAWPKS